jgi:hypothetical protein
MTFLEFQEKMNSNVFFHIDFIKQLLISPWTIGFIVLFFVSLFYVIVIDSVHEDDEAMAGVTVFLFLLLILSVSFVVHQNTVVNDKRHTLLYEDYMSKQTEITLYVNNVKFVKSDVVSPSPTPTAKPNSVSKSDADVLASPIYKNVYFSKSFTCLNNCSLQNVTYSFENSNDIFRSILTVSYSLKKGDKPYIKMKQPLQDSVNGHFKTEMYNAVLYLSDDEYYKSLN